MQDSTVHDQLEAWFERGDIVEIHAGDHRELETVQHILCGFPSMNALMTDLKSILSKISFLLKKIGFIKHLEKEKVVSIKISSYKW